VGIGGIGSLPSLGGSLGGRVKEQAQGASPGCRIVVVVQAGVSVASNFCGGRWRGVCTVGSPESYGLGVGGKGGGRREKKGAVGWSGHYREGIGGHIGNERQWEGGLSCSLMDGGSSVTAVGRSARP